MIDGVKVIPLKRIADERGAIFHMLRNDDPHFEQFGEIYFSMIYPGVVKGWHLHTKMTLLYAVPAGSIKLVLFDARVGPTQHELMELHLGEYNYQLVRIPPGVWNGFKGVGVQPALVANCASIPHDPSEIERCDPHGTTIPYRWDRRDG